MKRFTHEPINPGASKLSVLKDNGKLFATVTTPYVAEMICNLLEQCQPALDWTKK